jgi:class 3 adenylate cyclase
MSFEQELRDKVHAFAHDLWDDIPNGTVVPTAIDLTFGNDGKKLSACIFYADIYHSTQMVDALVNTMAAEYYKAFLHCAAKIIKRNSGEVTAYDGDRVMAVFLGDHKEDAAVLTAFELAYAVTYIINSEFSNFYNDNHRELKHTVGIDISDVLVSKTGVRVDNDLVWVGPSANYAAKLNSFDGLDPEYPTRITAAVLEALSNKFISDNAHRSFWDGPYTNLYSRRHYRSLMTMPFD